MGTVGGWLNGEDKRTTDGRHDRGRFSRPFRRDWPEAICSRRQRRSRACGVHRVYSHTYVSRWISGTVPRDAATRQAILDALGAQLGRLVEPDELGFRVPGDAMNVGLAYPDRPEECVTTVAQLLDADLDLPGLGENVAPNVAAWNDASLAWLVGAQRRFGEGTVSAATGLSDVERLRSMRLMFDRLDNQYGGAHARRSLVEYLRTELPPLLRSKATSTVRRSMFSAAAEATQLAAWMSYDSGLHGLAQRYFIQALGLADAADDRLLAAGILDAMSHQASFLGRFREAVNLARAARLGTEARGVQILTSHFHIIEARALARMGDAKRCDEAMSAAVGAFERRGEGDGPEWIQYFDEAELAAELSHCNRDLGRATVATRYATQALGGASGDNIRSDFFVTMVLADSYIDQGEIAEGCRVAVNALQVGEGIRSARCQSYVDEFRQRLDPHMASKTVRDFIAQVERSRLWTPARKDQ